MAKNLSFGDPGFWQGRPVFVTGATGFLGGHLCEALVGLGAQVVALVRDQVPGSLFLRQGLAEQCVIVRGGLEEASTLARALNEYDIDTVFHLGAQTLVGRGSNLPAATYEANVRGTWQLLDGCMANRRTVERVVVASSDKAYGDQPRLPYTEDMPLLAEHPYDVSKACADLIARGYARSLGLPTVATRLANLYGPGDSNLNRLVPDVCLAVAAGRRPGIRSDGTPRRDFIHVRDAVRAYLLTAEQLHEKDLSGQAFNFGNGQPFSVLELVSAILRVAGSDLQPEILNHEAARKEIAAQWLDSSKAGEVLGWEPAISMEEGLAETYAWYRELSR